MNFSNIFGSKKVKSFAEQLAEVKNVFRTSYDQAIALNSAIAEDIKVKQNEIKLKLSLISRLLMITVSIYLNLKT